MSDDDWDADDFEPPPLAGAKDSVKDSWDDEDQEEEEKPPPPPVEKPVEKAPAKPKVDKKENKKKKESVQQAVIDESLQDPLAEKLRQQRLVEEADLKNTKELFGKGKSERSLEGFIPKTEAEFIEYAELLAAQLTVFNKSFHYSTSLKAFLRKATISLNAADTKEIAASVTVIANEKLKAEKDTSKKKSGAKKKHQLLLDRPEDDDYRAGGYDDGDEYDFM